MADTVKIAIVSGFNPGGFHAAKKSMEEVKNAALRANAAMSGGGLDGSQLLDFSNNAKLGLKAASQLAGALGSGSGGLATAARGATGAIGAFAAGGVGGLVVAGIAAVTLGTIALAKRLQEAKEKALEAARAMREAFYSGLEKAKARQVANLKEEYADLGKEIDAAATRANKLASANAGLNKAGNTVDAASAANTLKNIEAGYSTRMSGANSPEEKATLAAERTLELVRAKNAENLRAAQADIAAADITITTEQEKTAFAKERLAAAKEQLALAEKTASQIPETGFGKARSAANEAIAAAKADIINAQTDLKAGELAIQASAFGLEAANTALKTARTEAAMRENEALDAQDEITTAITKRASVARALILQEERLSAAVEAEALARERGTRKEQVRNAIVAGGALGLNAERTARRDAAKQREADNEKEERWADNQERKLAAGTRISRRDLQRLQDFRDFKQLRNRGGQKDFDVAANEARKIKAMQDHLGELKKLNGNIEKALMVN